MITDVSYWQSTLIWDLCCFEWYSSIVNQCCLLLQLFFYFYSLKITMGTFARCIIKKVRAVCKNFDCKATLCFLYCLSKKKPRTYINRWPTAAKIAYEIADIDRKRLSSAVITLICIYWSKILNLNYHKIWRKWHTNDKIYMLDSTRMINILFN